MGIEVKQYNLGGSITADVYVQLGRQPVAIQRKFVPEPDRKPADGSTEWECIYVALAHATQDEEKHLCVIRQGGFTAKQPITTSYDAAYTDLKNWLTSEGYEMVEKK